MTVGRRPARHVGSVGASVEFVVLYGVVRVVAFENESICVTLFTMSVG